ncbi:MAG TPA: type IV secretion system DNA-binding domain-containing protein [Ktedonobacteraceae bacterium]|jgi:hypothetical protein
MMKLHLPRPARRHVRHWVAQLIPGVEPPRELCALATSMSGLSVRRQAIALEIAAVATATGTVRSFQVRAGTREERTHLCSQLLAHFPQTRVHPLSAGQDPLQVAGQETVSVLELRLGAPSALPLRTWQGDAGGSVGHPGALEAGEDGDPLGGVLAALCPLPPRHRAIVQLVLAPASATWEQQARRQAFAAPVQDRSLRHLLQVRTRERTPEVAYQEIFLRGLSLLLLVLLLLSGPLPRLLPPWFWQAGAALIPGRRPDLSAWEVVLSGLSGALLLAALLSVGLLWAWARERLAGGWRLARGQDPALVRSKTACSAYRAVLRLYVIGPRPRMRAHGGRGERILLWRRAWRAATVRRQALERLAAAFRVYHLAAGNFFVPRRLSPWRAHSLLRTHAARVRRPGWRAAFLTPEEVASLYHFPAGLRDLAFVERAGARTRPVPWQLTTGVSQPFGENWHQGGHAPVFFPGDILEYNLLALAGTGKGKSSLFAHLARRLFADGTKRAVVLVDPHGDLARDMLGVVPAARREEVVYLNLAEQASPAGLNFLDMAQGQDRERVVDMLLHAFRVWWAGPAESKWGPRLENTLQYCLLTLCEVNRLRCQSDPLSGPQRQCTILSMVPLLQRPAYHRALLAEISDNDIWSWWKGYYARQKDENQLDISAAVITRISKFRASRLVRRLVGQPVSTLSLTDIITHGHLLIMNTASGIVGEDTSSLMGSMLLGLLHTCIAQQAARPTSGRTPVYVFLDEMQKFTGVNLNAMLAELRKYGAHFALATQSFGYLEALDPTLSHTVLANTDQLFAFDMAAQDARRMAEEIGDGIEVEDILAQENYACYARLSLQGARLPAFSTRLLPPPASDQALATWLEERSAQIYGRRVEVIDAMLDQQDRVHSRKAAVLPGSEEVQV